MYSQTAFIIPMPEVSQNNVDAVIKPFQLWVRYIDKNKTCIIYRFLWWTRLCAFVSFFTLQTFINVIVQVWMALILAFASVIAILSCFNRLFQSKGRSIIEQDNPSTFPSVRVTESIFMYVVGTLLNQGKNKSLSNIF
jgi:hypothetical protein